MIPIKFVWFFVLFLFYFCGRTLGVYYIPQRTEVTYGNEKYVYNASAFITRYGRKSPYYYNIQAGLIHTWGNNVTAQLVFYEYQQNQYKRNFFEIHLKWCDMFERDPYIGKVLGTILTRYQITCPVPPGMYRFFNMTLPTEKMPNILSFEKGKVEATLRQLPTNDIITTLYIHFVVKYK